MSKLREQVLEFHEAMGQPSRYRPERIPDERLRLRLKLIGEEFLELLAALTGPGLLGADSLADAVNEWREMMDETTIRVDMPALAKETADLMYVLEGTLIEFGIDGDPVAEEVHRANLSKLGDDGKPVLRADGKVTKGPNYVAPDIERVLREQGREG